MYILVLLRFLHLNQQSCRSKLSFKYLIQYFTTAFWISVIVLFSFRRIPKLEKKSMMVLACGDVIQETRYTCLTLTRLIDKKCKVNNFKGCAERRFY